MSGSWRFDLATRGVVIDSDGSTELSRDTIPLLGEIESRRKTTIVVVQNVDRQWEARLGERLGIDEDLFRRHTSPSPGAADGSDPWKAVFGNGLREQKRPQNGIINRTEESDQATADDTGSPTEEFRSEYWHADGVLVLDRGLAREELAQDKVVAPPGRHVTFHPRYGWQASTRVTCFRVSRRVSLFLVDSDVTTRGSFDEQPWRIKLHVPVSTSRAGLTLPLFVSNLQTFSLFHSFQHFFLQERHLRLFDGIMLFAGEVFYLMATSTWKRNLAIKKAEIEQIAFHAVPRQPDLKLNTELHMHREHLSDLISELDNMIKWMPAGVPDGLRSIYRECNLGYVGLPDETGRQLLDNARALDTFLMDTFQLLMSTISVMAAESGLREARSAQKLMWLASTFLPLTFVTGIFGMNINVINDSPTPWWACLIALVAASAFTMAVLKTFETQNHSVRARAGRQVV